MNPNRFRFARLGAALLASAAIFGGGAAQAQVPSYGAYKEDAGSALSRHLRTLADNPRNLSALTGAGQAALQLGDPQAAITFFARAEEIAPRDGRIKAGIGSAFVQMEQPQPALKFFEDAAALGVNQGEFAGDRGLAYDVLGNPRQAQRDYQLALRHRPDPEIERRLALSLAISGDKAGALAAIDAQLRRQDRAGWRTRAFVLALTGDAAGANEAVQAVLPGQAAALRPFLARLAGLDPVSRAMAVHFGHFPGDGQTVQMAQNYAAAPSYVPNASTSAQSSVPYSQPSVTPQRTPAPARVTADRRRPGIAEQRAEATNAPSVGRAATPARPRRDREERGSYGSFGRSYARDRSTRAETRSSPQRTPSAAAVPSAPAATTQYALSTPRVTPPPAALPSPAAPTSVTNRGSSSQFSLSPPVVAAPAPTSVSPSTGTGSPASGTASPIQVTTNSAPAPAAQQPTGTSIRTIDLPGSRASLQPDITRVDAPPPAPAASAPASTVNVAANPAPATAAPMESKPVSTGGGLADIASLVNSLPSGEVEAPKMQPSLPKLAQADVKTPAPKKEAPKPAAKAEEPTKKETAKKETAKKETAKKEPAKPAEPARHWVQIAGGADRAGLVREFGKLKQKAPKLLADRTAWTTPLRFTNRLLVGPFKSEDEAQAFVNDLARADVTAFGWTSPAGQEIAKLTAK